MKKIAIKTYGKIITLLFALLGIGTGCEKPLPVPEYGVPAADFIIKGKVTDKESKKPIKNIAVIRKPKYHQLETTQCGLMPVVTLN